MSFSKILSFHYLAGSYLTDEERKYRWNKRAEAAQVKFDKAYEAATPAERAAYHAEIKAEKEAGEKASDQLIVIFLVVGFFWVVTGGFWMGFGCYLLGLFAWYLLPKICKWAFNGITSEVKYRSYKRKEKKAATERLVAIKAALEERRSKA